MRASLGNPGYGVLGLALITGVAGMGEAYAGNEELLKILLENGAINQQQYDALVTEEAAKPKISLDKGNFEISSGDGDFRLAVGGRVEVDSAWFSDDSDGSATGRGTMGDGTQLRRSRITVQGQVWNDWQFKGDYDFAQNTVSVADAWVQYTGLSKPLGFPLQIRIGHQKQPFSLEQQMASTNFTFMERALPFALSNLRKIGLTVTSWGSLWNTNMPWTASAGWFGDGITDSNNDGNDEGYGYSGRVTLAPFAEKTRVLHLGAGMEYRKLKGENVRVRSRPEANISDAYLVDATVANVDDLIRYNAEAAVVYGPFSAQAEYYYNDYDSESGDGADFDGYYGYMSYFLTGESRNYNKKTAAFGQLSPASPLGRGGWGAWEVAARYSSLNLNDGDINGGQENNWTFALNWYPVRSVRLMANYIIVDTQSDQKVTVDPNIFQVRARIGF